MRTSEPSLQYREPDDIKTDSFEMQAARCRRLAAGIADRQAADALHSLADKYDQSAKARSGQSDERS